jgi:hypothetical protein
MMKQIENPRLVGTLVGVIMTLALLLLAATVMLDYASQSSMDRVEWREESYLVKSGDCLWGISGLYCPGEVDRRDWIDEVGALNDLEGRVIHTGQRITVLVPVEEVTVND